MQIFNQKNLSLSASILVLLVFFASAVYASTTINSTGVLFDGATSGTVTMQPATAAGTWTMTLPTTDGDADQVLTTDGAGVTSWEDAGGSSYLVYTARINQNGANPPTVTVLQNTLSGTPVWTRTGTGRLRATLTGVFLTDKIALFSQADWENDNTLWVSMGRYNDDVVLMSLYDYNTQFTDYGIVYVEIRVYP